MPELAAVFAVGMLVQLSLVAVFAFLQSRRQTTGRAAILRSNLAKTGHYWSEHTEKVCVGDSEDDRRDRGNSLRTLLLTGTLLALMSWLGALFFTILVLSLRKLARSRLERELFSSRLAQEPDLSTDDVRSLLAPFISAPSAPAPNARPPEFVD